MRLYFSKLLKFLIPVTIALFLPIVANSKVTAQSSQFRFIAWGDTKSGTATLKTLSGQAVVLNPAFTIYTGDAADSGFKQSAMDSWKTALNGGNNNGMFDKTFAVRGNHDSSDAAGWQGFFNYTGVAQKIGATDYTELTKNLTYSFIYQNSMFIGVDVLGDSTKLTSEQITWMDAQLTKAEQKQLTHAFIFFHGPVYAVAEHCCTTNPTVTAMFNKHPIVSATFHGHEHTIAHVHMNASRISNITHEFEEIVTGSSGTSSYNCNSGRTDWCLGAKAGFSSVDVSGKTFTVNIYASGSTTPTKTFTFTKSGGPSPTTTPPLCEYAAPPVNCNYKMPDPLCKKELICTTPTVTATTCSLKGEGDANCDDSIDLLDFEDFRVEFIEFSRGTLNMNTAKCDFNNDGSIDLLDFGIFRTGFINHRV